MNPKVRTPISAFEVFSYLKTEKIYDMTLNEMLNSIMSSLVTSEEKVSSMFKSIIMHCEECDKDISIQNEEILELNVGDKGNNLQEILNRHLQKQVDNHFTTCHSLSSKRRKRGINATKISKEQAFLFLSLDKQMQIA